MNTTDHVIIPMKTKRYFLLSHSVYYFSLFSFHVSLQAQVLKRKVSPSHLKKDKTFTNNMNTKYAYLRVFLRQLRQ